MNKKKPTMIHNEDKKVKTLLKEWLLVNTSRTNCWTYLPAMNNYKLG